LESGKDAATFPDLAPLILRLAALFSYVAAMFLDIAATFPCIAATSAYIAAMSAYNAARSPYFAALFSYDQPLSWNRDRLSRNVASNDLDVAALSGCNAAT
jgi:hypothetical protein